jgi:shikimate kinase
MEGRAEAPAAGTVVNALANGRGCAFAIDRTVTAEVSLDGEDSVVGVVGDAPNLGSDEGDPSLIVRCVERTLEAYADRAGHDPQAGATVTTESEVPVAAGLKSSSAAANAAVLATCDALGVDPDPLEACRIGVEAARDVGVTVTGAFDDASASMLGGLTLTDNRADELLAHDAVEYDVLVWVPPGRTYSGEVDPARCERVAPMADLAVELAEAGRYATAMTVNGFSIGAALGCPVDALVDALPEAAGASPSGTGPAVMAVGERDRLENVRPAFDRREGSTWLTTTRQTGARTT